MKLLKHIYLLSAVALASCSSYLEEFSQDQYRVSSYTDLDELLIGDCYYPVKPSSILTSGGSMGGFIHFIADEIEEQNGGTVSQTVFDLKPKLFGQFTWQQRVGVNENSTAFSAENETWTETYRLINVANSIIAAAPKLPKATPAESLGASRIEGEARFLRAAYYFWLVNLYGKPYSAATAAADLGVPLKLQEEVLDILYGRNTVQEVYDQIIADLEAAEELLANTGQQKSIYRADQTAVRFLLSRVHLYMQHWEEAVAYTDQVIAVKSALTDLNGSTEAFLRRESVESIFSMGGNDVFRNMNNSVQSFRVSRELFDSYNVDDLRRTRWYWSMGDFVGYTKTPPIGTGTVVAPTNINYYNNQYFVSGTSVYLSPVSDKFLFRTAEMYLNKAEAEAYLGREENARTAVNLLRSFRYRAGANQQVTASGADLIRLIREERRRELALEGHRWFDLRRYGVNEILPESKRITHDYTFYTARVSNTRRERRRYVLEANDPAYTLPIPQSVIEFNAGMPNNERPVRTFTVVPHN